MKVGLFYQSEQYDSLEHSGNYGKLAVKVPGHSGIMQMRFSVPILDMHGYWVPESRTPSTKIVWVIESKSAGQRAFPFIAFFNSRQINRLSAGLTNLTDDARILAKMNQEKCTYDITIEVALGKDSQDFELVIDQRPQVWTDSLADWRKALALPLPEFPEGAWEPVFCTWYAVHAAVTQDWVEKNAEVASRLGFRTLIIDDGWCFDVMKRVSPETISTWYEMIGDWFLSEKKFPDFENHRKRVQAMGMKYLLWVAPFLIGAKSELYKQLADIVKPEYHEGCYTFDSSRKEAAKLLLGKMKHVIQDYGLDGLKVDFLDYIFPNNPRSEERRPDRVPPGVCNPRNARIRNPVPRRRRSVRFHRQLPSSRTDPHQCRRRRSGACGPRLLASAGIAGKHLAPHDRLPCRRPDALNGPACNLRNRTEDHPSLARFLSGAPRNFQLREMGCHLSSERHSLCNGLE